MKIKENYVIKTIKDEFVVVPIKDEAIRFRGIITLNNTAKFIFETLKNRVMDKDELLELMLEKYDADQSLLEKDIDNFVRILEENDLLE
ncbi:MAG: PqqD family protein [Candidatus Izemoplasmatales bacterium]|jgi:hypothetical protein|nr:PqqD family protein [Candidatus Izemoplasmatales bacterium]